MIGAIETQYKGYRFRSRLEARWAVLFDVLGIRWEYEKEGYKLAPYLFNLGQFIENNKAQTSSSSEMKMLRKVGKNIESLAHREIWYLPDFWLPDFSAFAEVKSGAQALDLLGIEKLMRLNLGSGHPSMFCFDVDEYPKGFVDSTVRQGVLQCQFVTCHFGVPLKNWRIAADAARSARFEHGEQGVFA